MGTALGNDLGETIGDHVFDHNWRNGSGLREEGGYGGISDDCCRVIRE